MKIKLHSLVDVITNSSTVIYTHISENGVKMAYELLNEIIKIAGSNKKAEDLFDIWEEPEDWDVVIHRYTEENDIENYDENIIINELKKDKKWKEYDTGLEFENEIDTMLIIKAKDKSISTKNIYSMFNKLFYQEAYRDG